MVEQTLDALYAPDLKNRGLWGGVTVSHPGGGMGPEDVGVFAA